MHARKALSAAALVVSTAASAVANLEPHGGARRLPAALAITIPLQGSLQPISGTVQGLPNPQNYKACVYLKSRAATYNGPKPFEDNGSSSPVAADGTFNYVNWWANAMYDPVATEIYVFIYANTLGNCLPTMGGPAIPPDMFTTSAAWAMQPRVNNVNITLTSVPARTVSAPVIARISGLPEVAATYKAALFMRNNAGLMFGPAPGCTAACNVDVVPVAGEAGTATATFAGWDTTPTLQADTVGFSVIIFNAAFDLTATNAGRVHCLAAAGEATVPGSLPYIAQGTAERGPVPSVSSTASVTPSSSHSTGYTETSSASRSPSSSPSKIHIAGQGDGDGSGNATGTSAAGKQSFSFAAVAAITVLSAYLGHFRF